MNGAIPSSEYGKKVDDPLVSFEAGPICTNHVACRRVDDPPGSLEAGPISTNRVACRFTMMLLIKHPILDIHTCNGSATLEYAVFKNIKRPQLQHTAKPSSKLSNSRTLCLFKSQPDLALCH